MRCSLQLQLVHLAQNSSEVNASLLRLRRLELTTGGMGQGTDPFAPLGLAQGQIIIAVTFYCKGLLQAKHCNSGIRNIAKGILASCYRNKCFGFVQCRPCIKAQAVAHNVVPASPGPCRLNISTLWHWKNLSNSFVRTPAYCSTTMQSCVSWLHTHGRPLTPNSALCPLLTVACSLTQAAQ